MSIDIPNYRVLEKVGVGAESSIYRARCMRTGRDYAVKIVKITKPEDTSYVELLRAEHLIGSSVDHPVIRKVFELRILRRRLRLRGAILFMEFVEGVPMSDKSFQRPLDEMLRLFAEVATGLHAMHQAGWVHADLKPSNILVTPDHTVKLIDLGQSSKIRDAKSRIQGTIDYIAPEQVQRGVLDARTDVFGLGAALHRVATGKPVLTEMNQTVSVYSQSLVGKRLSQIRQPATRDLPPSVAKLIDDCCQSNPDGRIADMPALIERIHLARSILAKQAPVEADTVVLAESRELDRDMVGDDMSAGPDLGDTATDDDPLDFADLDSAD